jgi:hypothetical protein
LTKARDVAGSPEVVLSSGTFSTVASLSLSSMLSDTYKFYTLNIYAKIASGNGLLNLRFRENTTDFTGANYAAGAIILRVDDSIAGSNSAVSGTAVSLLGIGTANSFVNINITRPTAAIGSITYQGWNDYNVWTAMGAARNTAVTNFNGITIYPTASTMTGYYILTGRRV